jgi:hypothetical protein
MHLRKNIFWLACAYDMFFRHFFEVNPSETMAATASANTTTEAELAHTRNARGVRAGASTDRPQHRTGLQIKESHMNTSDQSIQVANVTLASLVKLVSLLSAEMVVGKYREDIDQLESAVRRKLFATVAGATSEATAEGVALAHRLLDPMFRDLRARAALLANEETRQETGRETGKASREETRPAPQPPARTVPLSKLN